MIHFVVATFLSAALTSDPRPKGASLHAWPEDVPRKLELETTGVVRASTNVVAWFPAGALSDDATKEIVKRLDRGIAAAKKTIGKPAWAFQGDPRVFFYFPDARFVAHAPGGNTAFVPLWRIRDDEAPWLHESLHLLLATPGGDWLARDDADTRMPLWFSEGLPDALAIQISESEGLRHFSPLWTVPASGLDELCRTELDSAAGKKALPFIGAPGKLKDLFGPDRVTYAKPFYVCSASFVRFLAKPRGFAPLLKAIADFGREEARIERELGGTLSELKADWLAAIGAIRKSYRGDSRSSEIGRTHDALLRGGGS